MSRTAEPLAPARTRPHRLRWPRWSDIPIRYKGLVALAVPTVGLVFAAVSSRVIFAAVGASVLFGLAGGLFITLLFTGGIAKRSDRLQENAMRLARGEALLPMAPGKDEIGRLGRALEEAAALLHQRERDVRESEERFRLLAESSEDVISKYRLVPTPGLEYISPAVERVLGWTPRELRDPERMVDIVHPDDQGMMESVLAKPGVVAEPLLVRVKRKDGQYIWMEERIVFIRDENGTPVAIQGTGRDVTQRKQAEDALRESEALKSSILGSIAEGTVITDPQGVIQSINPAMERLSGWREEEVRDRPFVEVYQVFDERGEVGQWEDSLLYQAIQARKVMTVRGYNRTLGTRDGQRVPFGGTASPLVDDEGTLLGGVQVMRDVSFEKEVDQLKSSLVATVSHELRTPLTMIQGFSELLLARDFSREESREALQQIHTSAVRLSRLIDDLLSVSRMESGQLVMKRGPVDLELVAREVVSPFTVDRDVRLQVEGPLPPTLADQDMLVQIFTNLVSNAVKYSPRDAPVTVAARANDGHVEVCVEDRGIGMSDGEIRHLFRKFFRADRSEVRQVGGTGLGLYITKKLVEMQGGEIWVDSVLNHGTTFGFTLPFASDKDIQASQGPTAAAISTE